MNTQAPDRPKEHSVSVQVQIRDDLVQGRSHQELQHATIEVLIIRDYIDGRLSLGEVAEKLGMEYVAARDWLHNHGIATLRSLSPELEKVAKENTKRLITKIQKQRIVAPILDAMKSEGEGIEDDVYYQCVRLKPPALAGQLSAPL